MKIDYKLILISALIAVVIALISLRDCGRVGHIEQDRKFIYDSLERVIKSKLPPPDTIEVERLVTRWLPSARVVDTIYLDGATTYVYNDVPIDTAAILTHYLTQGVTYIDTIRDNALEAVISDTIFRNSIVARKFEYKILRPIEVIDKTDRFQLIASFQAGGGVSYLNAPQSIYAGVDLGLKFKSGTYFSVGYMAGSGHFLTIRAGQVIRLRR